MKKLFWFLTLIFLVGCKPSEPKLTTYVKLTTQGPNGVTANDTNGYRYQLVEWERKLTNGLIQAELWQRVNPLDTNYWYIQTAISRVTDGPIEFNVVPRDGSSLNLAPGPRPYPPR
jgi:hypothetical protein